MTQAAPTSEVVPRTRRTPDIFGEHTHARARLAFPVLLGLVYGYWAAANRRGGGPITGWNILFGFVTALVFVLVYLGVQALAPRLRRELHALLWTAFGGIAFGFLYNQSGESVLRTTGMSLAIAAVFFVVLFYRYYTHEDATGHRIR
ncbi:hypothetical protein [Streptomyces shenzhenensis]|uniref:Uncharacterized protein n=1 Tax=Streptomyces shenzhenensis TaxID=943815 RepID=A0A3M0IGY5_9ACTN|nr:hypothetical protein [Streptomyces shenzhenensis]RMB85509.1 hypothetical protein CTZ28_11955 [Streptomyces shenzhenensis]